LKTIGTNKQITLSFLRRITGFDLSSRKQRWKLFLLLFAALIVSVSLYFSDLIVKKIAEDELRKVELWAEAIQRRAGLVKFTEELFEKIKHEERKRVELLAEVYPRLIVTEDAGDLGFYTEILTTNTTIPLVLTGDDGEIYSRMNLDKKFEDQRYLEGEMLEEFSVYPRISFYVDRRTQQHIYYRDSRLFAELRDVLDDLVESFFTDIVSSANIPVIVTDSTQTRLLDHGNIKGEELEDSERIAELIKGMADKNPPILIDLPTYGSCYVFYTHSFLLTQLRYYPIFQFLVIGIFLLVAYVLFSIARNAEQNLVWVGMSKETAHQLGTPLSSLLAWVELLRMKGVDEETLREIVKDLNRLENITERFSKIGSAPELKQENVVEVVRGAVEYIKTRASRKIVMEVFSNEEEIMVPLNTHLFEWVLENILKNAIDAIRGKGIITVQITGNTKHVTIDTMDNGCGIPASRFSAVFRPGFTSKKRGWGLGLSLSKRIIENYHKGKLFVKDSSQNRGTTFRMVLRK
jgi:two-component system, sporulation sensor kinase D